MRATVHRFLNKAQHPDVYLLHSDMWGFPTKGNVINCGVQETNMVNIAAGLASQGKKVVIYGVAGFVIYKSYEQIKLNIKDWAEHYGSIVFINAGYNGCYKVCGRGHLVYDDHKLMDALDIPLFDPPDRKTFLRYFKEGLQQTGVRFIRLGWDNEVWRKEE
jgi:transketolase